VGGGGEGWGFVRQFSLAQRGLVKKWTKKLG
jgi:hypothetical protein